MLVVPNNQMYKDIFNPLSLVNIKHPRSMGPVEKRVGAGSDVSAAEDDGT